VESLPPAAYQMLEQVLACTAVGSPDTVSMQLRGFIERTGADELIITSNMYDPAARLRSYEIVAGLL
jgi:alkanesulfonate monooxygenase SsuD/methylene tetrahydromethanopterin reductase-like flavin-dependent oxidoreductase (luciferase family)